VQVLTGVDDDRIREQRDRDEFFWLDLLDPADEEVEELGRVLDLHPLAMEDTREFGQRPKADVYEENAPRGARSPDHR
jgi:magnesium transporter